MSEVTCLYFERELKIRRSLRRYVSHDQRGDCPCGGYCQASVLLDELHWTSDTIEVFDHIPHDDIRWPKTCEACGREFINEDTWQIFCDWLYRHPETGDLLSIRQLPIGAIWRAHWHEDHQRWTGPDGHSLVCRLPDGGDWLIDGPSQQHEKGWTRTGAPPKITVSPSILTDHYHGHLIEGVLKSC